LLPSYLIRTGDLEISYSLLLQSHAATNCAKPGRSIYTNYFSIWFEQ